METATLIAAVKNILPERFLNKYEAQDSKLSAYLDMVLSDINFIQPPTSYTLSNAPSSWQQLIVFGANAYAILFVGGGYSLKDFEFSDNGLTLNPNRQAKIQAWQEKLWQHYMKMAVLAKRKEFLAIRPRGVGSWTNIVGALSISPMYGIIQSLYGNSCLTPNTFFPAMQ